MDKIVNFLLEYYLWILAVLAISIITTIGIIADSRKKRNKKVMNEVKTTEPLPDFDKNENSDVDNSIVGQDIEKLDNVVNDENVNMHDNMQQNNINQMQPDFEVDNNNVEHQNIQDTKNMTNLPNVQGKNLEQSMILDSMPSQQNINNMVSQQNNNSVIPGPRPIDVVPINQPSQQMNTMKSQIVQQPSVKPLNNAQNAQTITSVPYSQNGNSFVAPNNVAIQSQYNNVVSTSNGLNMQSVPVQQSSVPNQPVMPSQMSKPVVSQTEPVSQQPVIGLNFVTNENNAPSENDTWNL